MITAVKDAMIIKRIKKKDLNAVLDWFDTRKEKFYRIGWAYLKNHHDIEDVFQNTILKVHDKIHQLREEAYFETWVTSIFINECRDFYRKNNQKRQLAEETASIPEDRESGLDMRQAISRLEEKHRDVIVLKYLRGYAQEEIAAALKLPVGTVKSRLYRGLLHLKKEIGGGRDDGLR